MSRLLQLIIATLLFFVLMFGLGFILNMLLKTTWFPVYAYIVLIIVLVFMGWDSGTLLNNITSYTVIDYLPAAGGLVGAFISGKIMKSLRAAGYKMF